MSIKQLCLYAWCATCFSDFNVYGPYGSNTEGFKYYLHIFIYMQYVDTNIHVCIQSPRFWQWCTLPVLHTQRRMKRWWTEPLNKPRPALSRRGNQNKQTSGQPQYLYPSTLVHILHLSLSLSFFVCLPRCLSACRVVCLSSFRQVSVKSLSTPQAGTEGDSVKI